MKSYVKFLCRRFFGSFYGWAILAAFYFFEGVYFSVFNLSLGSATMTDLLLGIAPVLIFLLPMLAVRVFSGRTAAEQRWLSALLVSPARRLLGEYLAALGLFLLASLPLLLFPLLLRLFAAELSLGIAYLALLGYVLMGAGLLALLCLVLRFVRRRLAGLLVGVGVLGVLYLLPPFLASILPIQPLASLLAVVLPLVVLGAVTTLWSRRPPYVPLAIAVGTVVLYLIRPSLFLYLLPRVFRACDVFGRLSGFTFGRLDLEGILFYVLYTATFLLLACLSEHCRRRTMEGRELA